MRVIFQFFKDAGCRDAVDAFLAAFLAFLAFCVTLAIAAWLMVMLGVL